MITSQDESLETETPILRNRFSPISVVVPVYNEHRTIALVVGKLLELEAVGEVIVVDDGSDEATRRVLGELATMRRVRVFRHAENRGKGAALRSGFAVCTGQVVAIQDADLEYSPEALPRVVQPILDGEADVVYGSRELGSRYEGAPWIRRTANRSLTWLSNRLTGLRITDMETGCKAFRREVLEGLTVEEERFGVEPELTAKVAAAGWRIIERPVSYQPRSYREGKKIGFRDGLWALWCIAHYSRRRAPGGRKQEGRVSCHREIPNFAGDDYAPASVPASFPRGFTLIEILVVIAIIGILVAITLPAVGMAREAARRSTCSNNLRQVGIATKLHLSTHGVFPTGGWGAEWMGDPNAGFGIRQPGGWVYNVLPFIEQQPLRDMGSSLSNDPKKTALAAVMATPIELLSCPSRRLPRAYPFLDNRVLKNVTAPEECAKSDYAINQTVSYEKSEVIASDIQLRGRGMSKTVLAGEKSVASDHYLDGESPGDRRSMYLGHCEDIARVATGSPVSDRTGGSGFGSSHPSGSNFVFCDGSIRFVARDETLE